MLPIAVDAMGGDNAPDEIVKGARLAHEELGVPVVLVGDPDRLGDVGQVPVVVATEVIGMADDPGTSVRAKKDSSLVRAAELVRDGHARAMVGAGNTGATMAAALLRMGRLRLVKRPAIALSIPDPLGWSPTVLLDCGANVDCTPEMLMQFARMGSVFCRERLGVERPRVGVLSIGEESSKGNLLVREARAEMESPGWQEQCNATFVGNVEGRDFMADSVDVIVTDGFTGNVALKTMEGEARAIVAAVERVFDSSDAGRGARAMVADQLDELFHQLDPDNYGGATLLGVKGVCIIAHGSSNDLALLNAIRLADEMERRGIVDRVRAAIAP